jgi:uncharacterized delta-60 repeat protein
VSACLIRRSLPIRCRHRFHNGSPFKWADASRRDIPEHRRVDPRLPRALNADGSLDTSFVPTVNGPVQALAVQSNGQILVGGSFSQVDGISRNNLARLNPDGTIDGVFNPSPNANINVIALQTGGQILIGGNFTALAPNGSTTAYGINYFARLNSDGSLDLTFNPSPNGGVFAVAFSRADGRLVVGGGFTNTIAGYNAQLHRPSADRPAR